MQKVTSATTANCNLATKGDMKPVFGLHNCSNCSGSAHDIASNSISGSWVTADAKNYGSFLKEIKYIIFCIHGENIDCNVKE